MRNIKLIVEYDGSRYYGLQKQPNKETVQSEIERAIKEITGEEVNITYSGRTDAGVSAYGFIDIMLIQVYLFRRPTTFSIRT